MVKFTYQVYYMRPSFFSDGIMGHDWLVERKLVPTFATLDKTHAKVRTLDAHGPNEVFSAMQGEIWSPNGEARAIIEAAGLKHTSMSVGDCLVERDGRWEALYVVDRWGFKRLGDARPVGDGRNPLVVDREGRARAMLESAAMGSESSLRAADKLAKAVLADQYPVRLLAMLWVETANAGNAYSVRILEHASKIIARQLRT